MNITYENKNLVSEYAKASQKGLYEYEQAVVKNTFSSSSKVLDIGCGCGRCTKSLFEMGFKVVGIDISKNMIACARQLYNNIDFKICDVRNMTCFADKSFDNAFFSLNGIILLNHKEKEEAIREISRVLKENSYFIFTMPFLDINKPYYQAKIKSRKLDIENFYDRLVLGEDTFNENNCAINTYVCFEDDMKILLDAYGFETVQIKSSYGLSQNKQYLNETHVWITRKA